jgi:hypothetical protein
MGTFAMTKLDTEREMNEADVLSALVSDDELERTASKEAAIAYYTYGCTGYHYCPGTPAID